MSEPEQNKEDHPPESETGQAPSEETPQPARRNIVKWLGLAMGGVSALAVGIPFVGYLLGPIYRKYVVQDELVDKDWFNLGKVDSFPLNQTRLHTFTNPIRLPWDGMTAHTGVYVRRTASDQFQVFAVNCTHLGCPVSWFPQSGLFMCPCHGGVYYENGEHASGPPPRGLYHYTFRVQQGQLQVKPPHLPTLQDTLRDSSEA